MENSNLEIPSGDPKPLPEAKDSVKKKKVISTVGTKWRSSSQDEPLKKAARITKTRAAKGAELPAEAPVVSTPAS